MGLTLLPIHILLILQELGQDLFNMFNMTFHGSGVNEDIVNVSYYELSQNFCLRTLLMRLWNTEDAQESPYNITEYS